MKALIQLITTGVDLTAEQRLWVRVAALTVLVAACAALYAAGRWDVVEQYDLVGIAVAIVTALVGLGQTVARQSKRPPAPREPMQREDTHPRLPIALPREGLPVAPEDFDGLDDDDRPTLRPTGDEQ
jgi:Zn-dependent protease